jgi:hypothetical protein
MDIFEMDLRALQAEMVKERFKNERMEREMREMRDALTAEKRARGSESLLNIDFQNTIKKYQLQQETLAQIIEHYSLRITEQRSTIDELLEKKHNRGR